ncbi:NADH-quinone oxidoreductase subunit M [Nocardioides anomalus]|uniref:NADH-quinone oxidoreductase subunit M n=1 Tax=Nocardioides anomalus TaxID=2712223 RepID=A0A6G6WKA1_9ACTN|nr:NADH-quinone oxidoreductase subunit M [Nocardioides anomalus]QIG45626.1 NADH-quinone oxidoreductase subunit M [Nocardioides anomalus]
MNDFPILTILWVVPLVGALAVAFGPRGALAKQTAVVASLVTLVVAIVAATQFDRDGSGFQLDETHDWITAFGVHYALGLDGLGLLLVLLTVVLTPIVLVAAWNDAPEEDAKRWFAWALALEALSLVVFLATDVFLFYVVFEATLIPAYFLIGGFGRAKRSAAALKFLMFQLGGGLVLLGSVIGLYVVSADAGSPSYLYDDLAQLDISTSAGRWLFAGFFIAFAVKAPLFPVHTWLADTTEQATPATSVLLVCVLDKIGTFGMLRFCLGLFPEASDWATPFVVVLALISIVYGAIVAIGQDDVLRLIGLTSLSHFGFITLGIFVFTTQGASGSILYMVNHGIATAALFLIAGFLIRRRGTTLISRMGGLEKVTPVTAGLFLVAALATAGLPGLSQFVSEMLVLISAFDYRWYVGAIAVTGIVLAAIYMLWAYQKMFTGPNPESLDTDVAAGGAGVADLGRREVLVLVPLMLALVFFGFVPGPLLDVSNPFSEQLLQQTGVPDDGPRVPVDAASSEGDH